MSFQSIITSTTGLTIQEALLCTGASVILGIIIAVCYILQGEHSKNFVVTLAVLPVLVQVVMMMVNGNLGTGIAVLGAFSLVRFRSVPGSSREIINIFFAMGIGLATGMGYISFALGITILVSVLMLLYTKTNFGDTKNFEKDLRITIPESLDYTGVFDDILSKYTDKNELVRVKTTNMGSMYELTYRIKVKNASEEKNMIDDLRCRNGNLTIICSRSAPVKDEL
jgi:hypothetical protein